MPRRSRSVASFTVSLITVFSSLGLATVPGSPAALAAQKTGAPFLPNGRTAYRFFLDKGLPDYQAAGIVGNLDWESHDDPAKKEKGNCDPCGMGIAQWTGGRWDKDRKDNVTWYAAQSHASLLDLKTQLNFIWYELTSFNNSKKKPYYGLAALRSAQNVTEAASVFEKRYERCDTDQCHENTRVAYAKADLKAFGSNPGEATIRTISLGAGVVRGPDGNIWYDIYLKHNDGYGMVNSRTMAVRKYAPRKLAGHYFGSQPAFDGAGGIWDPLTLLSGQYVSFSRFVPKTGALKTYPIPPACKAQVGDAGSIAMYGATNGDVWAECGNSFSSTVLVRITPEGKMATFKPPSYIPQSLVFFLAQGKGGTMWAIATSPGGLDPQGIVKISAEGSETYYADNLGLYDDGVVGNGSGEIDEVGICPSSLDSFCVESVAADGTRSIINHIPDFPGNYSTNYQMSMDQNGNLWISVAGTDNGHVKTGAYYWEVSSSGTGSAHAFTPPHFDVTGSAVALSDGTVWSDTNSGDLFWLEFPEANGDS